MKLFNINRFLIRINTFKTKNTIMTLSILLNIISFLTFMFIGIYLMYYEDNRYVLLKRELISLKIDMTNYAKRSDVRKRACYVNDHLNSLYGMSYFLSAQYNYMDFTDTIYMPTTESLDSTYYYYRNQFRLKYFDMKYP